MSLKRGIYKMIQFPNIDPIAFTLGPVSIRWYAIAYLLGILIGYWDISFIDRYETFNKKNLEDFIPWAVISVILGGRLGYVLFYNFSYYKHDILEAFKIWHGGMSFHGGVIGFSALAILFCKKHKINILAAFDLFACAVPIGIFFGRIANFINAELLGRETSLPWGVIFPNELFARHPSQIYEAILEGLLMFCVINALAKFTNIRSYNGALTSIGLLWYGSARIISENFREPDYQIGYILGHYTMGQMLSIPILLFGLILLSWVIYKKTPTQHHPE